MRALAPGVWQLRGQLPPNSINVYLLGDVLVDSATVLARRRILRQLKDVAVAAHVVMHAHPDHFGSSHAICEELGLPLWAGEHDADTIESGDPLDWDTRVVQILGKGKMQTGHPVARRLREGDEVAGFEVLEVPGHTPGHIALWREEDRTLMAGDVFFNMPRLGVPPRFLTIDPGRNRASMLRLAELRPALVTFGHGAPLRDPDRFARAAERAAEQS